MAATRRSSAAAGTPACEGSDGGGKCVGEDGRSRSKRPSASPSASPHKRRKADVEASENAPAAAGDKNSGAHVTGKPFQQNRQQRPRPWPRMLAQQPETLHVPIHANEICVGSGDNCYICLDLDETGELCLLRHLEQGGPCELEVIGKNDWVAVNGTRFYQGDKIILRGGDEVVFGRSGKHAYIFQYLENQGNPNPSEIISMNRWQAFKDVLKQGICSPDDIRVTSGDYPYYVSAATKEIFLSSAFIHMEKQFKKYLQEISSPNQRILLSSPSGSEMYQEALVKALAKHFDARILIIQSLMLCGVSTCTDKCAMCQQKSVNFLLKDVSKDSQPEHLQRRSPAYGSQGKVVLAFEKNHRFSKVGVRFDNPIADGNDLGGLCEENRGFFCDAIELRLESSVGEGDRFVLGKLLIEVISEESESSKLIVLLMDVKNLYAEWHRSLRSELPLGVLIIGSQTQSERDKEQEASGSKPERSFLNNLFPNKISIDLPKNEAQPSVGKLLEHDSEIFIAKSSAVTTNEIRAALMKKALAVLPPPPYTTILYKNQFMDLWACGRAREPWAEAWRQLPLVLHDANLADAVEINLPKEYEERQHDPDDLTEIISKALKHHPGPIGCLRLDRTACPGPGLLVDWMETLSAKEVRDLMMVNATRPPDMDFPVQRLRSRSLRSLALGFFSLPSLGSLGLYRSLPSLQDIYLLGCGFPGRGLSEVIQSLPVLSSLTMACCQVTAGCSRQGLRIESRTLRTLRLSNCTASAPLTIADAPDLQVLITGVTSALPPSQQVFIDLRSAPSLRTLQQLALHLHHLRVVSFLECLQSLGVCIQVCVASHAALLGHILADLPRLAELELSRVDNLPPGGQDDEACCRAWSLTMMPPCITSWLRYLVVRDYRGGAGEVALVRRVLSVAAMLVSVTIHLQPTVRAEEATATFDRCPRASKDCTIKVVGGSA